jgi:hypothetical protein
MAALLERFADRERRVDVAAGAASRQDDVSRHRRSAIQVGSPLVPYSRGGKLPQGNFSSMKNNGRGWLLVLFLALVVLLGIIMSGQTEKAQPRELTMQQLVNQFDAGKVKDFKIKDQVITGTLEDGTPYRTIGPKDMSAFLGKLAEKNVWPENDQSQSAGVAGAMLLPVLRDRLRVHPHPPLHAPDPGRRRQGDELRQVARAGSSTSRVGG